MKYEFRSMINLRFIKIIATDITLRYLFEQYERLLTDHHMFTCEAASNIAVFLLFLFVSSYLENTQLFLIFLKFLLLLSYEAMTILHVNKI